MSESGINAAPHSEIQNDLETEIEKASELLAEVIFVNRLRTRSKFFIQPGEVYHDEGNVNARAVAGVQREINHARKLEEKFAANADMPKKLATLSERALVVFSAKLSWLGNRTVPRLSYKTDDILKRRGADFWAVWKDVDFAAAASFDVTSNARQAAQKISNALEKVHAGTLHELRMGEVSGEHFGVNMRGKISMLPHFQIVLSRDRALQISELVNKKSWDVLAVHPMQVDILEQLLAQAKMYRQYAQSIKFEPPLNRAEESDSQGENLKKILLEGKAMTPLETERWRKKEMIEAFERCVIRFEESLRERRDAISTVLAKKESDIQKHISPAPDREHLKFMGLFQKKAPSSGEKAVDMEHGPERLRALATVLPPQQKAREKQPEYPPRLTRAMRGKPSDAPSA